jgi:hypothetical protein
MVFHGPETTKPHGKPWGHITWFPGYAKNHSVSTSNQSPATFHNALAIMNSSQSSDEPKDPTMNQALNNSQLEELQSCYSDFHKDVRGFRPRPLPGQWCDAYWLRTQITSLREELDARHETFWQREELRDEGWGVAEEEPHVAAAAAFFGAMREAYWADLEWSYRNPSPVRRPIEEMPFEPYEEYHVF